MRCEIFSISISLRQSRYTNSTIEIQNDLNTPLKKIKHTDGNISELFPATLGELFTYDGRQCYLITVRGNILTPPELPSLLSCSRNTTSVPSRSTMKASIGFYFSSVRLHSLVANSNDNVRED